MRSKSPELMNKICEYAERFYLDNGFSPSLSVIAKGVGICKATVHNYLVAMSEKGIVEYDGKEIHTSATRKLNKANRRTAIVGSISCGTPANEEENIEEYISLPTAIFGNDDYFILRANGESMINAGIDDNDLVVIKKQETADEGEIVVALVENENTLKRLRFDKKNKNIILQPENEEFDDIVVGGSCNIQGVAKFVIKAL